MTPRAGQPFVPQSMVDFSGIADRLVARGPGGLRPERDAAAGSRGNPPPDRRGRRAPARGLRDSPSQVRWRLMRGMRNLIAHEYQIVDPAIEWNTLAHELPVGSAAIQTILGMPAEHRD